MLQKLYTDVDRAQVLLSAIVHSIYLKYNKRYE